MEKPDKISDETYQAFAKAMKNVLGSSFKPSKNYLKKEINNPTQHVGCLVCNARQTTLYKVDGELYCKRHLQRGQ